jgi:CubicO group peptidase (beta-lactamase class C family)
VHFCSLAAADLRLLRWPTASGMAGPGNYGWGRAHGSLYRIDPQANLTIVLMLQLMRNETDFRDIPQT